MAEIKLLLKRTWIETYGSYYAPGIIEEITSTWHDSAILTAQTQNPLCYFALAKNETDAIIGIVTDRRIENEKTLQLDRLYVLSEYQGKGVGKELLTKALFAFSGITTVLVDVELFNQKQ